MKKIMIITFLLLLSRAYSQDKLLPSLLGTWKISILDVHEKIYFDARKDSIWLGMEILQKMGISENASLISAKKISSQLKADLKRKSLTFRPDGTYIAIVDTGEEPGTYQYDAVNKTVTLLPSTGNSEKKLKLTNKGELQQLEVSKDNKPPLIIYQRLQ